MANIIQRRRGTTQEHEGFTGAEGEITIDLDKETVVVHNDVQPGGYPLAREDLSNVIDKVGVTQLNLSEGGAGMVLQTNGAGVISFTNQPDISLAVVGGDVTGTVGNIALGENTVGVYELKLSEGQNGQILQTDGAGTISFTNQPDISASAVGGDISGTVGNAQIIPDAVGIVELDVVDGNPNDILSTDGNGALAFITPDLTVGGDLSGTLSTAQIIADAVNISKLDVNDGAEGTVVTTDGAGAMSFQRVFTETTVTPTAGQTVFPIVYMVGRIIVFLNGVKLVRDSDFTADNGTDVELTGGTALATEDRVEFHVFC